MRQKARPTKKCKECGDKFDDGYGNLCRICYEKVANREVRMDSYRASEIAAIPARNRLQVELPPVLVRCAEVLRGLRGQVGRVAAKIWFDRMRQEFIDSPRNWDSRQAYMFLRSYSQCHSRSSTG